MIFTSASPPQRASGSFILDTSRLSWEQAQNSHHRSIAIDALGEVDLHAKVENKIPEGTDAESAKLVSSC